MELKSETVSGWFQVSFAPFCATTAGESCQAVLGQVKWGDQMVGKKGILVKVEEERSWQHNFCIVFDQEIGILSTGGALL